MTIPNFLVVIFLYLCSLVCSDFFTAMIGYESLLVTHKKVIRNVDKYVKEETARLNNLERYLVVFKKELSKVSDVSNYFGNPINCYILIKRLSLDYDYIEDKLTRKTTLFRIPKNVTYPTNQDFEQAAFAVERLQVFYKLSVTQLADGLLRTNYSQNREVYTENFTPLSFDDCFHLARTIADRGVEYKESIVWLLQALQKHKAEDEQLWSISKSYIFNLIVVVYDKLANDPNIDEARDVVYENIIMWTKKLMDIETDQRNLMNWSSLVNEYHKRLTVERNNRQQRNITNEGMIKKHMTADKRELMVYKSLCRGETAVPEEVVKRLKCRYLTRTHPFLRLAPIKLEQLYMDPDLMMLHDVIGDKEIQHLKDKARLEIPHYKTHKAKTDDLSLPNNRITKKARIPYNTSAIVKRISQRIADITELNMVSAEDLQVANYGIGGYYDPHLDFADPSSGTHGYLHKKNGGRIATVLFYLSNVTQGGATVFLHLGVTVFPVKGAALLWRNLLPSGEVDHATRHAACPVLRGDKWVSTAWIHSHGQEFLRPCDLEYQNSTMPPRLLHRPVLIQKKKEQRKERRRRIHILM